MTTAREWLTDFVRDVFTRAHGKLRVQPAKRLALDTLETATLAAVDEIFHRLALESLNDPTSLEDDDMAKKDDAVFTDVTAGLSALEGEIRPVFGAAGTVGAPLSDHIKDVYDALASRDVWRSLLAFYRLAGHILGEENHPQPVFGSAPVGARGEWLKKIFDLMMKLLPLLI